MNSFINIATIKYLYDGREFTAQSEQATVFFAQPCDILTGEVCVKNNCNKWRLTVVDRETCNILYEVRSCENKTFSFVTHCNTDYLLYFKGNGGCSLRLYNVPDRVTVCREN